MADVELRGIVKRFGTTSVIDDVDLRIGDGEFVVFVGPSGSGKSTLLRLLAGLEDVSGGEIRIGGEDVTDLPPKDRGIAMVFQSYALYPHMSVYRNIAFGLHRTRLGKSDLDRRVRDVAQKLELDTLLDRLPRQLSGGQRQRVAIGRAIVREPRVFLFDEPLSNLDATLRVQMRLELAKLHHAMGTTMVYVTHDQVEAMTLADRIVVLNAGRIEQVGAPGELYEHPANLFVAGFIGSVRMNFLPARVEAVGAQGVQVALAPGASLWVPVEAGEVQAGAAVTLGVRPEHLATTPSEGAVPLDAELELVEALGDAHLVHVRWDQAHSLCAKLTEPVAPALSGGPVRLWVRGERCQLFDAAGEALPRRQELAQGMR
jgi:multiple sugar transport system ATP-binding protein